MVSQPRLNMIEGGGIGATWSGGRFGYRAALLLVRTLILAITSLSLVAGGCSPVAYRRSADRQVYRLLEDRTTETLGYQPQVAAGPPVGSAALEVPRVAYARIPETRRPPPVAPPLEPAALELPFGPLGPPAPDGTETGLPGEELLLELYDVERRYVGDLRLGPPAPGVNAVVELGLFDGIRYAVRNNRDYRGRSEDLYLAALDVTLERHLFRPRPFAGGGLTYRRSSNRTGANDDIEIDSALVATANAGVRQQLPYGGEVVASAVAQFVDVLDGNAQNAEDADLVMRASVPLLRGAGLINLEPLIGAERSLVYEVRSFERFRRSFAVDAARRYFNLRTQRSRVRNRYLRYVEALRLVDRSINFFAAGLLSALEVQRAQQQALDAEDSLNNAERAYAAALDNYKLFLGMDVRRPLEIVDVDLTAPDPPEDSAALLASAQALRLDLQTARDRVLDAQRRVANARNGLLPDLTVTARGEARNDDDAPAARFSGDENALTAGVNLDLPLDRLRERNQLRASLIGLDRAARRVEELEDRVIADVRAAQRELESARTTLRIQRENIAVAEKRLALANESLQRGLSTNSRNVVEAQNSLLAAQDAFEAAEADYQIAVLNLLLASGTLRVDPTAGTLGRAMWRGADVEIDARGWERKASNGDLLP